ncbi:MAG: ABC transporter substrate-binding protein [Rhodospirillaceae bacterium]
MRGLGRLWLGLSLVLLSFTGAARAQDAVEIRIGYLGQERDRPALLANLEVPPEDEGLQGARLAIADNNTTGRFMKQAYMLEEALLGLGEDPVPALQALLDQGLTFIVLDLEADALDAVRAHPAAQSGDVLLFNAGAADSRFRNADCAPAIIHTSASRAMLADALGQLLISKRWREWFLVVGPRPGDALYAEAIKRTANRFGAEIVEEKPWSDEAADIRRSARREIPVFTQGEDYDILLMADEVGDYGDFFPYQTWRPRPVGGTTGLTPRTWHKVVEAWAGIQLQQRFREQANRPMTDRDYAAWLGARIVGEAATLAGTDPATVIAKIRDPGFSFAGFKGKPLSIRAWNGQVRQPIPVVWERALVAMAPIEGFLHPVNPTDSLGQDEAEVSCKWEIQE